MRPMPRALVTLLPLVCMLWRSVASLKSHRFSRMSLCFFKRWFAKRHALLQALKARALDSEQQQVNFGARFLALLAKMFICA